MLRKHLHFRAFDLWQELYFHAYHTLGGRLLTAAKMRQVDMELEKRSNTVYNRNRGELNETGKALSRNTPHIWRILMNIPSITLWWKRHTGLEFQPNNTKLTLSWPSYSASITLNCQNSFQLLLKQTSKRNFCQLVYQYFWLSKTSKCCHLSVMQLPLHQHLPLDTIFNQVWSVTQTT